MNCKLCNGKITEMQANYHNANFCYYCELFYSMIHGAMITGGAFYNEKAKNRIPTDVDTLLFRLKKYIEIVQITGSDQVNINKKPIL